LQDRKLQSQEKVERSAYHFQCLLIAVFSGMFCGVWVQPSVLDELMYGYGLAQD
jgi:hypothetical protein